MQVLYYGLPAATAAVCLNSQLTLLITSSSSSSSDTVAGGDAARTSVVAATALAESAVMQQALLHLSQEAFFASLMPAACWLALGNRVVHAR